MENQKQESLAVANQLEQGFITLGKTARALRYEAAETIRRLHARVEELEAMLEAVGAGGVSAQRVTQAAGHIAQPQPQADARDAERVDALYKALEVCSAELFAQCAHQGRAMKYVEQARKALAAEQCARAAIAKATGGAA